MERQQDANDSHEDGLLHLTSLGQDEVYHSVRCDYHHYVLCVTLNAK